MKSNFGALCERIQSHCSESFKPCPNFETILGSVPILQLKSFQNIMTESPREELNLLVIFWCANEKSLLWNISFLFSIARFGGIVYCCPSCLEIFRAAQCWNAPETPSDEDSIVIFWNLISALLGKKWTLLRLPTLKYFEAVDCRGRKRKKKQKKNLRKKKEKYCRARESNPGPWQSLCLQLYKSLCHQLSYLKDYQ